MLNCRYCGAELLEYVAHGCSGPKMQCNCGASLTVDEARLHRCPGAVRFDLTPAGVKVLTGEQPQQLGPQGLRPADCAFLEALGVKHRILMGPR